MVLKCWTGARNDGKRYPICAQIDKSTLSEEQIKTLRDAKLKEVRKTLGVGRGRPQMPTVGGGFTRAEINAMRDALVSEVKKELKIKPQHKGVTRKAGRPKKRIFKK